MPKLAVLAWYLPDFTDNFYILWLDNNNDLPTLDKFGKLQLHAQKWDTNTVPTDYLQVCLVDPYQCCGVIWIFKEPLISYISNIKEPYVLVLWEKQNQKPSVLAGYLNFSKKIVNHGYARTGSLRFWEPWLCKNWVFDVLRTMVMQELGLWCFENHDYDCDNHQGSFHVSDNHSTPVPTRCWLEFFWPK
jgi:hypothetical protein